MAQRVFVKVVGFSAAERHALNTVFRLSEERHAAYALWAPGVVDPPALLLLDGTSADAAAELQSPYAHNAKLIWVGPEAPAYSWRVFERPIAWPQVIQAIDRLFAGAPPAADRGMDLDLGGNTDAVDTQPPDTQPPDTQPPDTEPPDTQPPDTQPPDTVPPRRVGTEPRALIASADRDQRLYLRARLALVGLTSVDEAESAGQAVELVKRLTYRVAIVEHHVPEVDGWFLLKRLRAIGPDRPSVILAKSHGSLLDRLHAWVTGAAAFLPTPPDPGRLDAALRRVVATSNRPAPSLVVPSGS